MGPGLQEVNPCREVQETRGAWRGKGEKEGVPKGWNSRCPGPRSLVGFGESAQDQGPRASSGSAGSDFFLGPCGFGSLGTSDMSKVAEWGAKVSAHSGYYFSLVGVSQVRHLASFTVMRLTWRAPGSLGWGGSGDLQGPLQKPRACSLGWLWRPCPGQVQPFWKVGVLLRDAVALGSPGLSRGFRSTWSKAQNPL